MRQDIRYEVLSSLPAYGPMYVSFTISGEEYFSEGFVVRFFKSDQTEWIANFKKGWSKFNCVRTFKNSNLIMVIAGGTCYIINPDNQKPKEAFGVGYQSLLEWENNGFVLGNQIDLTVFQEDGSHWDTERVSLDGLKDLVLEDDIVRGYASEPGGSEDVWSEFSLNLKTEEIIGGYFYPVNNITQKTQSPKTVYKSKPWWKIW